MRLKSIFFLIIFSGFLITPAVITCSSTNVDISYFYSLSEEENKDGPKVDTEKVNTRPGRLLPEAIPTLTLNSNALFKGFRNWKTPFLETLSPPPEIAPYLS